MANHPITPPSELVQQWLGTYFGTTVTGEVSDVELALATQAARWGADAELEACCEWLDRNSPVIGGFHLRIDRRPKPPSLKELALEALKGIEREYVSGVTTDTYLDSSVIRRALEALDD